MQVIDTESDTARELTEHPELMKRVGQTLKARYRIDRVLHVNVANGTTVYAGIDLKGGRIAIKCLAPERASDPAVRAPWVQRTYLSNSVGHASAVNVIDDGLADDGAAFVVMELVEARSLEELRNLRGGVLPTRLVCAIATQCLELLACAHAQRVFHDHLSTTSLFWTRRGQLKVLGFGSGATPVPTAPNTANRDAELAAAAQRDLQAFAETLFLMLGGVTVAQALAVQPGAVISELLPGVPKTIAVVIERGLTPRTRTPDTEAAARWTTAQHMLGALQLAIASALGSPIDEEQQPMVPQQPAPVPSWALLTVALVGCAVLGWTTAPSWSAALTGLMQRRAAVTTTAAAATGAPVSAEASAQAEVTEAPAPAAPLAPLAIAPPRVTPAAPKVTPARAEQTARAAPSPAPAATTPARAPADEMLRAPIRAHQLSSTPKRIGFAGDARVLTNESLCAQLGERRKNNELSPEFTDLWAKRCATR